MVKNPTCRINSYTTNLYSLLCRGIFAEQKGCMVCLMPINQIYLLLTLITMTMVPIFKMFKIDPKNWPLKLFVKLSQPTLRYYPIQDFVVSFSAGISPISAQRLYILTTPMYFIYCIQCAVCSVFCTVCSVNVVYVRSMQLSFLMS